jgi:hypothetical protein
MSFKGTRGPFSYMVAAEHLDEAKKALADGYRPDTNLMKAVWGRVNDARRHLEAIGPESPAYVAVRGLMNEVHLRERKIEIVCIGITNHLMIKQREILADELEQYYLNRGILVNVELSGPDKTFLRLVCPLLCETSIERILYDTFFLAHLRKAGFKRVMLGDNEAYTRTYSIEEHGTNNMRRTSVNRKDHKGRKTKAAGNDRRE